MIDPVMAEYLAAAIDHRDRNAALGPTFGTKGRGRPNEESWRRARAYVVAFLAIELADKDQAFEQVAQLLLYEDPRSLKNSFGSTVDNILKFRSPAFIELFALQSVRYLLASLT
jgi:hypothetical protein